MQYPQLVLVHVTQYLDFQPLGLMMALQGFQEDPTNRPPLPETQK